MGLLLLLPLLLRWRRRLPLLLLLLLPLPLLLMLPLLLLLLLLQVLLRVLLLQLFHPKPQPRVLVLVECRPLRRRRALLHEGGVLLGRNLREATRRFSLQPPQGLWERAGVRFGCEGGYNRMFVCGARGFVMTDEAVQPAACVRVCALPRRAVGILPRWQVCRVQAQLSAERRTSAASHS